MLHGLFLLPVHLALAKNAGDLTVSHSRLPRFVIQISLKTSESHDLIVVLPSLHVPIVDLFCVLLHLDLELVAVADSRVSAADFTLVARFFIVTIVLHW